MQNKVTLNFGLELWSYTSVRPEFGFRPKLISTIQS